MPHSGVAESTVEDATLSWFGELGYAVINGPTIAPGEMFAERAAYGDVVLTKRLHEALVRINRGVPVEAIDEAIRKISHPETPSLVENNRRFHLMLTNGIEVEYRREDGSIAGDQVFVVGGN
jgi:type I restriction enzyme R subunit